jgi:hypothetical protein
MAQVDPMFIGNLINSPYLFTYFQCGDVAGRHLPVFDNASNIT